MSRAIYIAAEAQGTDLVLRKCAECGRLATTNAAHDAGLVQVQGSLPEICRRAHGNRSVEIRLVDALAAALGESHEASR